jgi:hypothetical protein
MVVGKLPTSEGAGEEPYGDLMEVVHWVVLMSMALSAACLTTTAGVFRAWWAARECPHEASSLVAVGSVAGLVIAVAVDIAAACSRVMWWLPAWQPARSGGRTSDLQVRQTLVHVELCVVVVLLPGGAAG